MSDFWTFKKMKNEENSEKIHMEQIINKLLTKLLTNSFQIKKSFDYLLKFKFLAIFLITFRHFYYA